MLTNATYVTEPDGWGQHHGVWTRAEIETYLMLRFQNGPVQTRGVNGVQLLDVLQVCTDFARVMQRADPSRPRAMVITKLDEAMLWERKRAEASNTPEDAAARSAGRGA
jgi:hypothetical protein